MIRLFVRLNHHQNTVFVKERKREMIVIHQTDVSEFNFKTNLFCFESKYFSIRLTLGIE